MLFIGIKVELVSFIGISSISINKVELVSFIGISSISTNKVELVLYVRRYSISSKKSFLNLFIAVKHLDMDLGISFVQNVINYNQLLMGA